MADLNILNSEEINEINFEQKSKTIFELKNDIKEFQKKERVYIVQMLLKDEEIRHLDKLKNELKMKKNKVDKNDIYLDPHVLHEFNLLKNQLREKDEMLLAKDEELNSYIVTNGNHPSIKRYITKCQYLHKENMESFSHTSALENMRQENSLEKKQIEQLMLKLREKDNIQNELEKEISEGSETLSFLSIKLKELEEKNQELEKDIKQSRNKI